jgi:hypothetical protein
VFDAHLTSEHQIELRDPRASTLTGKRRNFTVRLKTCK